MILHSGALSCTKCQRPKGRRRVGVSDAQQGAHKDRHANSRHAAHKMRKQVAAIWNAIIKWAHPPSQGVALQLHGRASAARACYTATRERLGVATLWADAAMLPAINLHKSRSLGARLNNEGCTRDYNTWGQERFLLGLTRRAPDAMPD